MESWTPKDIQDFFWSLGPAAVGLFLIWFAQTKVAPNKETGDQRMRLVGVAAYAGCWVAGIASFGVFVFIWISPYLASGRYIHGALADVPIGMSVSTIDTATADVFFISERTKASAPVRTFAFVIHDVDGRAGRSTLSLSFASNDNTFIAGVDLRKVGKAALLSRIELSFKEAKQQNGDMAYSLVHEADGNKNEFPLKRPGNRIVGKDDGPNAIQFAGGRPGGSWLANLLAAYAQSAPSKDWTRPTIVAGLESPSLRVRDVAIQELADRLYVPASGYAAIAEAIVTRTEESATLRGRWSVYEATKVAIVNAREQAAARNGILDPPIPVALPLSEAALTRVFVDALANTQSANDAAKWLFRHSGDRRLIELLFRKVEAEQDPDTKACYAAFAANVFYNWAVDVFLAGKTDKREWFVSDGDLKLIESLYARTAALSGIAAADGVSASQFLIAGYGLGLFYAELSLLPATRLKGPLVQSPVERERWAARSKVLMGQFAGRLAPGSKLLQDYRFPFHRDVASGIASSGISAATLDPTSPKVVNPAIRDIVCKVSAAL